MSHKPSYKAEPDTLARMVARMNRTLSDLPKRCAVCDEGRNDPAAIATHNLTAARYGCRRYPL